MIAASIALCKISVQDNRNGGEGVQQVSLVYATVLSSRSHASQHSYLLPRRSDHSALLTSVTSADKDGATGDARNTLGIHVCLLTELILMSLRLKIQCIECSRKQRPDNHLRILAVKLELKTSNIMSAEEKINLGGKNSVRHEICGGDIWPTCSPHRTCTFV